MKNNNFIRQGRICKKRRLGRTAELFNNSPKLLKYIKENDLRNYKGHNLMWDVLWGQDDYIKNIQQASVFANTREACKQLEYEATLNKNQIN